MDLNNFKETFDKLEKLSIDQDHNPNSTIYIFSDYLPGFDQAIDLLEYADNAFYDKYRATVDGRTIEIETIG